MEMKKLAAVLGGIFLLSAVAAKAENFLVGTSADYPPFEWVDGKSNLVGLDMDTMRAIAIMNNYTVELRDVGFDTLVASLQNDKLDIAAGIQINDQRRQVIDASTPYTEVNYGIAVRKDSKDNLFTAIQPGKKISAQRGTAQARWFDRNVKGQGIAISVELYDTNDLAVLDLVNGRVDAYVGNTVPMREFIKKQPIRMSGVVTDLRAEFAYLVKKGDPKKILPRINASLEKMKEDGTWADLTAAYFTGDLSRITDCYAKHGPTLNQERNVKKYAADLKACMVP
jgi:polar amino acid transport system substrate-binding protein